jgi:hypothetical protein
MRTEMESFRAPVSTPHYKPSPAVSVLRDEALPEIQLQSFIDIDNDILGFYAVGHHDVEAFWAAVKRQRPEALRDQCRIRYSWLWIYPHGLEAYRNAFEELPESQPGAQPATLVEFWG